ncbi:MAG: hypothetical protein GX022_01610 [Clostridiaceae bacterium]|nr:hypothetical protein [Clostridiaceae bacterium]
MTVFFTCIIFIGIVLTVFSLILMLYEKKRLHDYRSDLKEKKDQLISVIEDAEELIEEMNRFSDYAVTRIEEKNNILMDTIAKADLMIQKLQSTAHDKVLPCEPEPDKSGVYDECSITKILEEDKQDNENKNSAYQMKGKVLTFDVKRREIIKLARAGLESTEIARILNCGKGEIELIARMGR